MRQNNFAGLFLLLVASFGWADSAQAPKKKLTLQDLLKSNGGSSKRSATVAGVRGLDETSGESDTKVRNYVGIEKIEQIVIHPEDLDRFIAEGKLK